MTIKIKILRNDMKKDSNKVAKIAIFNKGGDVLLLKRSDYMKKFKNSWDLPGGHVHVGEEIEDGLKREVREETNIDIKEVFPVFQKKSDHFFYGIWSGGLISLSKEHTSFIFATEDQLDELEDMTSYYRKAIKRCYELYKEQNQSNE